MSHLFWTEERIAKAARLWAEGLSITAIAKAVGASSRSGVGGIMNRQRARFPRRGRPGNLCKGGRRPKPAGTRAEQRDRQRANAARAAERRAKAAEAKAAAAPAPQPALPATLPIRFADAVEHGRCLLFIGDPLGPGGPDMPVCGGERAAEPVRGRYCPYHKRSQFRAVPA